MKLDPSLLTGLCALAERAINKALKHDPGTRTALSQLSGKVFALEVTNLDSTFFILIENENLIVKSIYDDKADCHLKGSVQNLFSLLFSDNKKNLLDSGVTVTGDVGLLMALTKVSHKLDIDWEEALNEITGDLVGHHIANLIRTISSQLLSFKNKAPEFIGDYLTEELRAVPSESELNTFYQGVGQARSQLERIERRLERIIQGKS